MASNEEKIIDFYSNGKENDRSSGLRSNSIEFHYTKKLLSKYISSGSNVIELGCATGYYGLFFADLCSHYTGVDISPDNISIFNEQLISKGISNIHAVVGDATDLSEFADNSFDVVLCLGPMYHLPHKERLKVFDECSRIARSNAILAFAYMNRIGVYAGACVNDNSRDKYPNMTTNKYVFEYSTDDERPGTFLFTSPEEMEDDAKQKDFEVLKNCGLDFFFASNAIDIMDDEKFNCYLELADRMSESRSCVGLSSHALLICRKKEDM